ncbi:MAG: hypothetical protein NTV68_00320 [Methanomicrobiales archaeon]|nr:hypothetical protein [Methanomicrobiales archaeon]
MGDANADAESRIVNSGTNLQADILKIGHHGSAMSSSSVFLTKAQPKTSVIEVGAGNPYGHPTSATYGRRFHQRQKKQQNQNLLEETVKLFHGQSGILNQFALSSL